MTTCQEYIHQVLSARWIFHVWYIENINSPTTRKSSGQDPGGLRCTPDGDDFIDHGPDNSQVQLLGSAGRRPIDRLIKRESLELLENLWLLLFLHRY